MRKRLRMGLVAPNFSKEHLGLNGHKNGETLEGHIAIGHTRYSTTGSSTPENIQPLVLDINQGPIAIAHNGNLTNGLTRRLQYRKRGGSYRSTTDSEVIGIMAGFSKARTIENALVDALQQADSSFSLLVSTPNNIYAARDPHGMRPLSIGFLDDAIVFASETCALDAIGAKFEREVEPGELIIVDHEARGKRSGYCSRRFASKKIQPALCLFELIYFARPDSEMGGTPVEEVRRELGRQAAREHPVEADIVTPVPDSGLYAAEGFAEQSGIPFRHAYVRNHYIPRTFIQPDPSERSMSVSLKLRPIRKIVQGKRVVVVDDSIIRGTTMRGKVAELRHYGAREVHIRVSCPPTKYACHYGIDFPTRGELIANQYTSIEKIRNWLGADSLGYVSMEGTLAAAKGAARGYCTACWTGEYPTKLIDVQNGHIGKPVVKC
jgi:amidophosphoribosyltransferase